jgi:type I restriction enzyme S subunit
VISRNSINGAFPIKRLGEVVEFLDNKRRPVTESDRRAGPYPYYGANGVQGTVDEFIFDEPLVLLAEDGGHFGEPERGIAYRISGKTWVNNHAHVLRPTSLIELAYLCRVLENYDVTPFVTGTTRGKLTKAGASEIVIPLPPLAEQRRIAEVLDRAEALRAKRRAALAQLDSLTQSLFLDLFGDPATNPKGWPMVSLESVLSIPLHNGLSPSKSGKVNANVLTLSAITGNRFDATAWKTSTFMSRPPANQSVSELDFLICRGNGNVHMVGKGYFPSEAMPEMTFPDTMIAARISPERIERAFLQHVWNSSAVRKQVESVARTTNGTFKVNQPSLEGIQFVSPPIPLQREFARRVTAVEALKTAQRASLAELDALFATLQHHAFKGEL